MKNLTRTDYVTRDSIMKLLSDDEVSCVSTSETAATLPIGDQYIDLEQLGRGVQQSYGTAPTMGRVLPRKAVHESTWNKILTTLAASHSETTQVL